MASGIGQVLLSMLVMIPFFAIMGFIMLVLIRKRSRWQFVIGVGMTYCLVALFLFVSAEERRTGHSLTAFLEAELAAGVETASERQMEAGMAPVNAEAFKNMVRIFIIKPIYAWMLVSVAFTVIIMYLFVSFYAMRRYGIEQSMPQFEKWRAGEYAAWLLIASFGVVLFPKIFTSEGLRFVAVNILVVMANYYFFIGLAVSAGLMMKYKVPPMFRYLFFAMIVFISSLAVLIVLTGVLDTWFNFRDKKIGGKDEGDTQS